jgi:hypothetical protein
MARNLALVVALLILSSPGAAQGPVRQPLPVPNLPGLVTLKGDFHLHSVFSDGQVWPTVHVQEAWRDGLDVISLTEHAEYHPHKADVRVDGGRSYDVARPLAERLGIILIPGVEITKDERSKPWPAGWRGSAHFNALFVKDANALSHPELFEALRRAKTQGAFVFWDHPGFRAITPEWFPQIALAYDEKLFQGMELVNGPDFYPEAYPWIEERKLTILCNSDAHQPMPPRETGWVRPLTLLFARTADAAGVRDALESRRTAAWMGGEVWGAEEHLRGIWQGAVTNETPELKRSPAPFVLRLKNTSAIPFRARLKGSPPWFRFVDALELKPEATTVLLPQIGGDAPAGTFEIQFEITNVHIGPGRNLVVTLPLTLTR